MRALNVEVSHLLVGHDNSLGIGFVVEFASNRQAGSGGRGADQFDDNAIAEQRFGPPILGNEREQAMLSSRPGEFHPRALLEPYVKLSLHTAPDVRPPTRRNPQWAKRLVLARITPANHSRAPLGRRRRRLNLLRAQRIKKASTRSNVQVNADLEEVAVVIDPTANIPSCPSCQMPPGPYSLRMIEFPPSDNVCRLLAARPDWRRAGTGRRIEPPGADAFLGQNVATPRKLND